MDLWDIQSTIGIDKRSRVGLGPSRSLISDIVWDGFRFVPCGFMCPDTGFPE